MDNMLPCINGKLTAIDRDTHFTDLPSKTVDFEAGDLLASEIGDLYIDFQKQCPIEQWMQVVKALRIHGFEISFAFRND